ncbi:hypothetical protein RRG08_033714 [Elysia crispata]|uniref:Uncharacterized protein n=1 Tax=Elysia crispata TaxID=231223 RepID=A0AAE1A9G4_9GAST|nr:hypothetical protein RRG08_033714 [Elysia crispata]
MFNFNPLSFKCFMPCEQDEEEARKEGQLMDDPFTSGCQSHCPVLCVTVSPERDIPVSGHAKHVARGMHRDAAPDRTEMRNACSAKELSARPKDQRGSMSKSSQEGNTRLGFFLIFTIPRYGSERTEFHYLSSREGEGCNLIILQENRMQTERQEDFRGANKFHLVPY